jgi:hypothetical protein
MLKQEDLKAVVDTLNQCKIHENKIFGPEQNRVAKEAIRTYFASRFSTENLNFLVALNRALTLPGLELQEELEYIYKMYLARDAETAVNLDSAITRLLHEHFNSNHDKYALGSNLSQENKEAFIATLQEAAGKIAQLIQTNISPASLATEMERLQAIANFKIFEALAALPDKPLQAQNTQAICDFISQVNQAVSLAYATQSRQSVEDLVQREVAAGAKLSREQWNKFKDAMTVYERKYDQQKSDYEVVNYRVGLVLKEVEDRLDTQEEQVIKGLVSEAKKEIKKYPYTGIEQHSREFSLPSLGEYVREVAEQAKRQAALNTYAEWEKFIKKTKSFATSSEKFLEQKKLGDFDRAYKDYAESVAALKSFQEGPAATFLAAKDPFHLFQLAKAEWKCVQCLKKAIEHLDQWLDFQSKTEANVNLKSSELFKNVLGLKEELLKNYADKMERFIENHYTPIQVQTASFFQPASSSSKSPDGPSPKVSHTAETSSDSDNSAEEEWWNGPGRSRGKSH